MSHQQSLRFPQFPSTSKSVGRILPHAAVTKSLVAQKKPENGSKVATLQRQYAPTNNLSDSETDISTSTENLSTEQRYVLRHTSRVEPQGQENFPQIQNCSNETQIRNLSDQCYSSNLSSDSTRYSTRNRTVSGASGPVIEQQTYCSIAPNINSCKEINSNRSSVDVSTCSYNTLIIHNDENIFTTGNRELTSPPNPKKEFRSYGEREMQEITGIPDDYLNQSHVLKHLAKEIKLPVKGRMSGGSDTIGSKNINLVHQDNFSFMLGGSKGRAKTKSKSQPDLTKFSFSGTETLAHLANENASLKQQLHMCCMKVAKTKKLEDEVANIYRVYEELVQSCERREQLERVARMRLQENLQKVQVLNSALKDQVDIFQTQLSAPSEHQILIAQLFTQNKELCAAKERQDVELSAQQATLQEQRTHIGILDTALNNAQRNIRRLEEELRKKQIFIEKLSQVCGANPLRQNERKIRLEYENDLSKDSNRSGSSTSSESKWHLQKKNSQIRRLECEQGHLEEETMRQNTSEASLDKASQETKYIIAEAKYDKLRYLEEVHSAQHQVSELQIHLKGLESRLAEKDALLRALQAPKICGSSFDSYNLSTDCFALNQLRYNTPPSFNISNASFNMTTNTSITDPPYVSNQSNFSPTTTVGSIASATHYGCAAPSYNQSVLNLQSISIPDNYSPSSSNYSASFDPNANYTLQNSPTFTTAYDDHISKQIDEQLNKVSQLSLLHHNGNASKTLDEWNELNPRNNHIIKHIEKNKSNNKPHQRTASDQQETFY